MSAIVLWEIEKLHQRGRIPQGLGNSPLKSAIDRLHIWPITPDVCLNIQKLDFQSDPADELIAATSLTHNIPLVTRDSRIRASAVISCI
jgi:PIN domain nuclease of toxin-antitoxin system